MNALRRLRKLEATFTDRTGLVRYSTAWWEYWMKECDEAIDDRKPRNLIPLDVFRAWLQAQPNTDSQYDNEA